MEDNTKHELLILKEQTFLDIPEAAQYLRVSESTFRKLVAERYHNIPICKLGRKIIFKRDLLDRWMEGLILSGKDL